MKKMKKAHVHITFLDINTEEKLDKLYKIETLLNELGIYCGT